MSFFSQHRLAILSFVVLVGVGTILATSHMHFPGFSAQTTTDQTASLQVIDVNTVVGRGPAPAAPAPASNQGSSASMADCSGTNPSTGTPTCGQCIPSGCGCSGGAWICTADCKPVPGGCSSVSSTASQSSTAGGPPPPAPAPAAAAPASASSGGSSASSHSSAQSSASSTSSVSSASSSSSSMIGGPPPPPSQCPRRGGCQNICLGSFPEAWRFQVSIQGNACDDGQCRALGGWDLPGGKITLRPDNTIFDQNASCVLSATVAPPTCKPPGTIDNKWVLRIYENIQGGYGGYYSDLSLNGIAQFRGRSPWQCYSQYNEMAGGQSETPPNACELTFPVQQGDPHFGSIAVMPDDTWCQSSSSVSSSSLNNSSSSTIGGPPPPAGSSSSVIGGPPPPAASSSTSSFIGGPPPSVASSSSSAPKTNSCDDTACLFAGDICKASGKTCRSDPSNPPQCYRCDNAPSSSSSVSNSTSSHSSSSSVTTLASSSSSTAAATSSSSTSSAAPARCGNGITEKGETCDLGDALNGAPGSSCSKTCLLGDGELCTKDQQCDSTSCMNGRCTIRCATDTQCPAGMYCNNATCAALRCGDGRVTSPETCDLGKKNAPPTLAGTACACDPSDPTCKKVPGLTYSIACIMPTCGDGVIDNLAILNGVAVNYQGFHESCDLGTLNGTPGSTCSKTCTILTAQGFTSSQSNGLSSLPPHTAPTADLTPFSAMTVDLPLLPGQMPTGNANGNGTQFTGSVTAIATNHAPAGQTGPAALAAMAAGAAAGWSWLRRKKTVNS